MSLIIVAAYRSRWGESLCVEKPDGCGKRVSGVDMDGTNKQIARFTVDADKLIEAIQSERWERGA